MPGTNTHLLFIKQRHNKDASTVGKSCIEKDEFRTASDLKEPTSCSPTMRFCVTGMNPYKYTLLSHSSTLEYEPGYQPAFVT